MDFKNIHIFLSIGSHYQCTDKIGKMIKFKLSRKSIYLSLIYTAFQRPVLKYASGRLGGCSEADSNILEAFQL